jgi:tetratricopeptide (TPR) repeat protein
VNWDDAYNFTNNYAFRGLGWKQIEWAFTARHLGVFQPLAWLLLELEYCLFGLDPSGYHAVSLLLHSLNCAMLFVILGRFWLPPDRVSRSASEWLSLTAVVAFFAWHPLRVEVVAWASCQPYLLCAWFVLLSVWFYLRSSSRPSDSMLRSDKNFKLSVFFFFAACLSKATAAFVPILLIGCDVLQAKRSVHRVALVGILRRQVPFFILSLVTSLVAVWARAEIHQSPFVERFGLWTRLFNSILALSIYLTKTLVPYQISNYYARPNDFGFIDILVLSLPLLVAALAAWFWRRCLWAVVAFFVGFAALAANLGIVQIGSTIASDRYTYMATLAVIIIVAAGTEQPIFERWSAGRKIFWQVVLILILTVNGVFTKSQCRVWSNSFTLWQDALAKGADRSEDVHNNLGLAYLDAQNLIKAESEFRLAIDLSPRYGLAQTNLGITLTKLGEIAAAREWFWRAIDLDAQSVEALNGFAYANYLLGDLKKADEYNQKALELRPDDPSNLELRAQIAGITGRLDYAFEAINKVLALTPKNASALNTLGAIRYMRGDILGSISAYKDALQIRPIFKEAQLNLADALLAAGEKSSAAAQYQMVLTQDAKNEKAQTGLLKSR